MAFAAAGLIIIVFGYFLGLSFYRLKFHSLRRVPGPWTYAISSWRLKYDDLIGHTSRQIHAFHSRYGPVIRIGPSHVSFNSTSALKTIYGVGSRSNRTTFYEIFKPYGQHTMFTMSSSEAHSERKKFLVRAYAKTGIVSGKVASMIETKVAQLLHLFEASRDAVEICHMLYFFTLDVSTGFIFTDTLGTKALTEDPAHRALLRNLGISKRGHRTGVPGILLTRLLQTLRLEQAVSFKHVRAWALQTSHRYMQMRREGTAPAGEVALITELCEQRDKRTQGLLRDIDIASECADHLGAGVETTRNTMIFLIWVLSLPENRYMQDRIRAEVLGLDNSSLDERGIPSVEAALRLTYVNAVVKEALRLYAPLPQLQPRFFDCDMVIDGYFIPAMTTVSMAPFTQHRNEHVYEAPYQFDPGRWLGQASNEMQRWWWPFSNGSRACTGVHLAMSTMSTLVAGLYSQYHTSISPSFVGISPAIVSLFETFWDERFDVYRENTCFIDFKKR